MKYKCLIVDDEQLARQLIEGYVARIPGLELVDSCKNPLEALDRIQNESIDIVFLDIQLPELLGTEFVKLLRKPPAIVFITAYRDYAIQSYELDVVDYLLKPIAFERFMLSVNRAIERIQLTAVEENVAEQSFITVNANHRIYKLNYDDIIFIEGLGEYVTFHTSDKKLIVLESLKKLAEVLPPSLFIRTHRSYIINKSKIESLYGNQIEIQDQLIPIGKTYKDVVSKLFGI